MFISTLESVVIVDVSSVLYEKKIVYVGACYKTGPRASTYSIAVSPNKLSIISDKNSIAGTRIQEFEIEGYYFPE